MHWWPLKPCFLIGGLRSIQTIMRLLIAQCRPLSATFLFRTAGFSQWNWLYQAQRKVRVNGPVDWPDALMAPMKPFFLIGGLTSTPGTLTGGIPATLAPAMASEVWVAIVLFRFSSPASLTTFVQLVGWVTKNQLSKDFKHEDRSWTTRSYITVFLFFLKNASFVKRLTNHSNFFQNKLPMSETVACQILIFRKNILQWGPITCLVENVILICDIFKIRICDNCTSNPSLLSGWIPSSLSDGGWRWTGEGDPPRHSYTHHPPLPHVVRILRKYIFKHPILKYTGSPIFCVSLMTPPSLNSWMGKK